MLALLILFISTAANGFPFHEDYERRGLITYRVDERRDDISDSKMLRPEDFVNWFPDTVGSEYLEAVETPAVEERTGFENDSECDQLFTTEVTFETTDDLHNIHALIRPMINPDRGLDVLIVEFSAKDLFTANALLDFFYATGSIRSVIGKRSANARIAPQERNDLKAPLPPVDEN
ncbi:Hypothetical predicted protein [Cloeon dipterum]|uniref:Uncharacterized protein n=1 Tax=Cloeon dipterum TaxID=197152 RepID=A0A8S1CWX7_9INSE|nr:Hypothetical predicted protein [Cloeon dipterum]